MRKTPYFTIAMVDDDSDEPVLLIESIKKNHIPITIQYFQAFDDFITTVNAFQLPCLIIMDINLPRKTGIECVREIKANPLISHIPIITFSNSLCQKYEEDSKNAGALKLLRKPTTSVEYENVIKELYNICQDSNFKIDGHAAVA